MRKIPFMRIPVFGVGSTLAARIADSILNSYFIPNGSSWRAGAFLERGIHAASMLGHQAMKEDLDLSDEVEVEAD